MDPVEQQAILVLALADDLTGALEVGAKFAERGMPSLVLSDLATMPSSLPPVLVLDTETRHLRPQLARTRVQAAAHACARYKPRIIYKKTDSTLRGNIAAEIQAVCDVFSPGQLVYAPAYPEQGRTVK